MAQLVVMYKTPKDPAAFDKHYFEIHVPLAKKTPGLTKYEVSRGPVATPAGSSAYHLLALLHYDDVAAIEKAPRKRRGPGGGGRLAELRHRRRGHTDLRHTPCLSH